MSTVIALSGRIGSGKTSLSHWLARQIPATRAGFGDYVRHLARALRLDADDRRVLQEVGALMAQYPDDFCAGLLDHAGYRPGTPLVVDGVRHVQVLEALRSQVAPSEVILVFLEGDPTVAARRVRERDGAPPDLAQYERHSTEVQVRNALRSAAQAVIRTDGVGSGTVAELGRLVMGLL